MKIKLLLIITTLKISACSVQTSDPIAKVQWLVGTWEHSTARGSTYENWIVLNAEELLGKSYLLKDKDTVVFETIRLIREKHSLVYIPIVSDQNDSLPVRFTLNTFTDTSFRVENQLHDFPQNIYYRKIGSDSLIAEISGLKNGQEQSILFPMKRVK